MLEPFSDKLAKYADLVQKRRECGRCEAALLNPSKAFNGCYDSSEIGPYARWQGNLDASLLVVAQDFADVATFEKVKGWPGENVATNLTLVKLMAEAGVTIKPPRRDESDDQAFFTNAVLCLKQGAMSAPVPNLYFRTCGKAFLRQTIDLVKPRAVVLLGFKAVTAFLSAYDLKRELPFRELVLRTPSFELDEGICAFAVYHPSPIVQAKTRPLREQLQDWRRIRPWLPQNET